MVGAFDGVDADGTPGVEIEHGFWIEFCSSCFCFPAVTFDQTACFFLVRYRRFPRLVDELVWIIFKLGTEVSDELALGVCLFRKRDGRIAAIELRVECCAGEPLPIPAVAGDFMVNEPFFEDLGAALPVDIATAAGKEACDGVAAEMVDPSFLSKLSHQGVNPGEACLTPFPAIKPCFSFEAIDVVVSGYETVGWVDFGGQMPGNESAMAVSVCLSE